MVTGLLTLLFCVGVRLEKLEKMIEFDIVLLYQFGFYSPDSRIEPEPKILTDLLKAFDGTGFMPTTVQEMHLGLTAEARQQLHLVTKNLEWSIEFEPHRISFNKKKVAKEETQQDFVSDVSDFCSRLSSVVQLSGYRLSYVTKGLLPELEEEVLCEVSSKLMNLPKFYIEHRLKEWTTRNVATYPVTINDNQETFNVITDLSRVQGARQKGETKEEFDRVSVGFDINTHQKNRKQRFQLTDFDSFIQEATNVSQLLLKGIGEVIL